MGVMETNILLMFLIGIVLTIIGYKTLPADPRLANRADIRLAMLLGGVILTIVGFAFGIAELLKWAFTALL